MSKFFLISVSIAGAITLGASLLIIFAPTTLKVTKQVWIDAPTGKVYEIIRYQSLFPKWSPWLLTDPNQKHHLSGTDGTIGATFHWQGVAQKSEGSQVITKLIPNKEVVINCFITQPFQSNPEFSYSLAENQGKTLLTQTFTTTLPKPFNAIATLMGLEKNIAQTNNLGLQRLKNFTEKQYSEQAFLSNQN